MFSALKPALEELAKNAKKAPGWAPLAVLCYFAFYLLLDRDVLGLSMAAESKKFLVEHKELLGSWPLGHCSALLLSRPCIST
jgi:hypothetical protein